MTVHPFPVPQNVRDARAELLSHSRTVVRHDHLHDAATVREAVEYMRMYGDNIDLVEADHVAAALDAPLPRLRIQDMADGLAFWGAVAVAMVIVLSGWGM